MRTYTALCGLALLTVANTSPAAPIRAETVPLRGTVSAADGSPATAAAVWAASYRNGPYERRETVADEKGRFTLDLVPGSWKVWAHKGTQGGEALTGRERIEIVSGRAPELLPIRLEERGVLRGRLLEAESGKPIIGGKLFLDAGIVLTTGSGGRFDVGGLSRTNHEAFVVAPGRVRMRVLFDTTGRADTELDVPVPSAGKIVARVTDLKGKPISGAYVGRYTSGSHYAINALWTDCDTDGRFEYDDAVPPNYPTELFAAAPGYVEEEQTGLSASRDAKPLEMNFQLRSKPAEQPDTQGPAFGLWADPGEPGVLSGRVVDREGRPIRNFRVLVEFPRQRKQGDKSGGYFAGYSSIGVRFTSPDGSFALSGVEAGSVHRITALAEGHGVAMADRVTAVPLSRLKEAEPVTLKAGTPVDLRVRAVTTDGKPIAEVGVTLLFREVLLDQSFAWGPYNAGWQNTVRSRTGADGWCNFPGVRFGAGTLLVEASGYGRRRVGWRNKEKELTVELAPEVVIAGVVRDAAGAPVKECSVKLTANGDEISAYPGPNDLGRFRIAQLPAGKWTVLVLGGDGLSKLHQEQVTVKAGETKELMIETKKELEPHCLATPEPGRLWPGVVAKSLHRGPMAWYNFAMKSAKIAPFLDRLVDPLSECLTPESARKLLALKADAKLQARIDDLADRHSQGLLTTDEQAQYSKYVSYGTFVAILKSKARQLLANTHGE